MNKKELIVTDTIWYRIYKFFRKIFPKKNNMNSENEIQSIQHDKNNNFIEKISYKEEINIFNRKKELAEKLMNGEITINNLSDAEVDEMTEYFTTYINEMNQKLEKIKKHILDMKNN
jgi:Mg2+ and Co2+ transporter CorA